MNILIIGDTHEPFTLPTYWEWCARQRDKYKCDKVIHIGDLTDQYVFSTFGRDPRALSMVTEICCVRESLRKVSKLFPEMTVLKGNHDERYLKRGEEAGFSSDMLISFEDFTGVHGWSYMDDLELDDVCYTHTGPKGGKTPALNNAKEDFMSTVQGHYHTVGGVGWHITRHKSVFGLDVGCGVDPTTYAVKYAGRRVLHLFHGCGVVLDGQPISIHMEV